MELISIFKALIFDINHILYDLYTSITSVQGAIIFIAMIFVLPRILVFLRGRVAKFFKVPRLLVRAFLSSQNINTNELIILISGIRTPKIILWKTQKVLNNNFPNADVLKLRLDNAIYSNATPNEITSQINDLIHTQFEQKQKTDKPYEKVTIISHSIGALFAKSAVIYSSQGFGLGRVNYENHISLCDAPWRKKLEKMVFLGGIHSGFDRFHNIWISFFTFLFEFMGIGKLILACENGMPYVETLRNEWIELVRNPKGTKAPICVQISGDDDWAIPKENLIELSIQTETTLDESFFALQIGGTSHLSILDMTLDEEAPLSINSRRAQILLDAINFSKVELAKIALHAPEYQLQDIFEKRAKVKRIIFVYDDNRHKDIWNETITKAAQKLFDNNEGILVSNINPPILSRFSFIFNVFGRREKSLRWFQNHCTTLKAYYPYADFGIIAINNGSWICAQALKENHALQFKTIFLVGSILPRDFSWDEIIKQGRLGLMCNCLAHEDLFCAIIGGFYAWLNNNFPIFGRLRCFSLGDSGFAGFNFLGDKMGEIAYLSGTSESYFESKSTLRFSTAFAAFGGPDENANILATEGYRSINNETDPEHILIDTIVTSDYVGNASKAAKFLNRYSWAAGSAIAASLIGTLIGLGFIIFAATPFYGIAAFAIPFVLAFLVLDSY